MAVFKDPLDHSAAIGMNAERADGVLLLLNCGNDELYLLVRHLLDALLDHMVSILVEDAVKDGVAKLLDEKLLLI